MVVSDDDKALFQEMMKVVKPLKKTEKITIKAPVSVKYQRKKSEPIDKPKSNYYLSNYYTDVVRAESILSYCSQDIPRTRLQEFKRGHIRWEARLDLHGYRPDAAREALCDFIDNQLNMGHRHLLIIHGKGGRFGEEPVLKNHVNHWLQQLPSILAFHSAQPRDGGTGAVYVLLKRQRDFC